jgi:hypothetical protein
MIVVERIDARRGDVGIGLQITGDIEERIRIAPFMPPENLEMLERVGAGRRDVRIVR